MKKFIVLIVSFFVVFSLSFSQVQLDIKDDKNIKQSNVDKSKNEKKKAQGKSYNNKNQNKQNNIKNNKNNQKKQPAKKPTKKEKYVFKKQEQNVYKFDEKGNPIIKQPVKKSSETIKKGNDFSIGIEEKDLKIKGK